MNVGRRAAIWSSPAVADLHGIWDHYAGRARDELRPGVRSIAATPHVIFYLVDDQVPQIVRVLDSRRDIDEIFADEA